MALSPLDHDRLRQALDLAQSSIGLSEPNPRVGCVIGRADGSVLGTGFTQQAGRPHAEVMALRDAQAQGRPVQGATAWVTLEPCAHHGRTPPCCDALVAAGVARVVVAIEDPFAQVAGRGIARLRAAGIAVDVADGPVHRAARELNIGFFSRCERGLPWVRLKVAASLDGRTALLNGASQWITGAAARSDGHAWRKRSGAVLTGIGTVLADDPRLDVREVPTAVQPKRVLVDSTLRLPPQARWLAPPGERLVVAALPPADKAARLQRCGAEVLALPGAGQRVDLLALLALLAGRGVNELHVEAGAGLSQALLAIDRVDELLVYVAPTLLGAGRGIADGIAPLQTLPAPRFAFCDSGVPLGADLRLRLRRNHPNGVVENIDTV